MKKKELPSITHRCMFVINVSVIIPRRDCYASGDRQKIIEICQICDVPIKHLQSSVNYGPSIFTIVVKFGVETLKCK